MSTKFLDRRAFGNECDDEASNGDWSDLGWTVVAAPQPLVAGVRIADVTAQFWGAPAQHPAPTPVIGRGQTEAAGVCDYPTVIRTRTRGLRRRETVVRRGPQARIRDTLMTQPADDDTPVTVHASDFTRWPELVNYAQTRGITLNQAIIQLVNSGLSHL